MGQLQSRLSLLLGVERTALLKRLLKLYAIFAVAHTGYKVLWMVLLTKRFARATKHLPGLRPDHTAKEIAKNINRLQDYNLEIVEPYREAPLCTWAMPGPQLVCNTPEAVEFMLKTEFDHLSKPGAGDDLFEMMRVFLGRSVFTLQHGAESGADHERWYQQRKLASMLFTKGKFVTLMHDTFVDKAFNLIRALQTPAQRNAGLLPEGCVDKTQGAQVVDMQSKFFGYTFDSIQRIFFGVEVDSVSQDQMDPYAEAFDGAHRHMMSFVISAAPLSILINYLPYPFGQWSHLDCNTGLCIKLLRRLHPDFRAFRRHVKHLHEETEKRVRELRKDPDIEQRQDLMSSFLQTTAKFGDRTTLWTDEDLKAIVLNFIIAGRDTTACTLTWMFYELCLNPDAQRKVQEELDRVLQGRVPSYEDVSPETLPFLNGCLYETLRLHPPVPQDVKVATTDIRFLDGTLIPKHTGLFFLPYVMGRDPKRYPDPLQFKPERWMPFKEPSAFEMPTFQAGPRFCLGKDLAKWEAKLLTSLLLQRFSFALEASEGPENITYSLGVTMALANAKDNSSHNLWLVPRPREAATN